MRVIAPVEADAVDILSSQLTGPAEITLAPGTFRLKGSVTIPDTVHRISGKGATVVLEEDGCAAFLIKDRSALAQPLIIEDIEFAGPPSSRAVEISGSHGVTIRNCQVEGMSLVLTGQDRRTSSGLHVMGNRCNGVGHEKRRRGGIELRYVRNAVVSGNQVENYTHGIMWWGGEANYKKKSYEKDVRGASDIIIEDNVVRDVSMGGIWGSRGERISVERNVVERCGDVGIDFEGCRDAVARDNIVRECRFGGLAVFFSAENVRFSGNAVSSTRADWPVLRFFNVSQRPGNLRGLVVDGNFLQGIGCVTSADDANGCTGNLLFKKNQLVNVRLELVANNASGPAVLDNMFILTQPLPEGEAWVSLRTFGDGAVVRRNIFQRGESDGRLTAIRIVTPRGGEAVISDNLFSAAVGGVEVDRRAALIFKNNKGGGEDLSPPLRIETTAK